MSTNNRDQKVLPKNMALALLSTPEQSQINCSQKIYAKGVSSFPAPSIRLAKGFTTSPGTKSRSSPGQVR